MIWEAGDLEEAADQGTDLPLVVTADADGAPRIQTPWPAYPTAEELAMRERERAAEAARLAAARRRAVRG